MLISVIISTYNQPEWLEKVLWGYAAQEDRDFEIVIADDGSGSDTRALIERCRTDLDIPEMQHVWHEDQGFRKSTILNKATQSARGDYLIFSDGDCVPRADFIKAHRALACPGHYLSGGYFKLPMTTSKAISHEAITSGAAFELTWLSQNGLPRSFKSLRIAIGTQACRALDWLIPTKKTWNGNNSSAFKEDILRVNGHDERMAYGGQDVEMGFRLVHAGVVPIRVRYRALVLHLDHSRGYAHPESIEKNKGIRAATLEGRLQWTEYGIE